MRRSSSTSCAKAWSTRGSTTSAGARSRRCSGSAAPIHNLWPGVRELPVQFAGAAIEGARLQIAVVDPRNRRDFRVVAGGKNLVGRLEIGIAQHPLDDGDAGLAQQGDDPRPGYAGEEGAVRCRREYDAVLRHE